MLGYRLRQALDGIRRVLRVTTLAEHEVVVSELNALNLRLDAIAGLIDAQAAARVEAARQVSDGIERRLQDAESRLAEKITGLSLPDVDRLRGSLEAFVNMVHESNLDRWKIQEYEGLLRYLRREEYARSIREGRLAVPRLETEHPLALASNDTRFPRGSKNDNSIAVRFNQKLYRFLGDRPRLRILDLGCAGGGFVRTLIDDGHFAVGLDGSDYPLINRSGEWATIPLHLLTCDVTRPFRLTDGQTGEPLRFDAITAWEVMEHIPAEDLPGLFENIQRHLAPGGFLLFSIATFLDWDQQTGTVWHSTVKPREWWEARFVELGFRVEPEHPFGKDDWLRGSGQCRYDWHEDDGLGFHVVLTRRAGSLGAVRHDGPPLASVA